MAADADDRENFSSWLHIRGMQGANMSHYECGNLFRASKSLLEGSGLVRYNGDCFVGAGDQERLEKCWRDKFDQEFGRYMAWVWFSSVPKTWRKLHSSAMDC